jgi:thiol-disulfide isomerase/thioredoxin
MSFFQRFIRPAAPFVLAASTFAAVPSVLAANKKETPIPIPPKVEYKSGPINGQPLNPNVEYLCADLVEEKIHNRDNDVLMVLYAPWCGACSMTKPIIYGVGSAMKQRHDIEAKTDKETPCCHVKDSSQSTLISPSESSQSYHSKHQTQNRALSILMMDDSENAIPGFLNGKESEALPLIKFYPKCGSNKYSSEIRNQLACQPKVFEGRTNVEATLNFIYQQMDAEPTLSSSNSPSQSSHLPPFDLDLVHTIAKNEESHTNYLVQEALVKRVEQDTKSTPAMRVHEMAPCGDLLASISYRSKQLDDEEESKLFSQYQTCLKVQEEQIEEFWLDVKDQADNALNTIYKSKAKKAGKETMENKETPASQ